MRRNPWFMIVVVGFVFTVLGGLVLLMANFAGDGDTPKIKSSNSLLVMEINGPIMESRKWLKKFYKAAEDKKIKGILLRVDSPGGAVGPSEEIYMSLLKFKEKNQKPIVVYAPSLIASGAYYISMAADKIITTRGSLVGSIGVIMSFANLEGLYGWAKINRYSITSGKLKDAGAEYRAMTDDERGYFQELIDETYQQFFQAVLTGRQLTEEQLKPLADGRIFNGQKAVETKMADAIGTEKDALDELAVMAGLGKDYEVYEPPKHRPSIFEKFMMEDEEEASVGFQVQKALDQVFQREFMGRPLFMMPSYLGHGS